MDAITKYRNLEYKTMELTVAMAISIRLRAVGAEPRSKERGEYRSLAALFDGVSETKDLKDILW